MSERCFSLQRFDRTIYIDKEVSLKASQALTKLIFEVVSKFISVSVTNTHPYITAAAFIWTDLK